MGFGTGHGATLAWTGGPSYAYRTIGGHDESADSPDISHLGSIDTRKYLPPDIAAIAPFTVQCVHDAEAVPMPLFVKDVLTLTYPLNEGEDSPATLTGNAWAVRRRYPELQTNQERVWSYDIQWEEQPTYQQATSTP